MATGGCKRFPSNGCFDQNLKGFEEDTMTKFVVWTKDKAFGVDDPKPGSKKIMWELQYVPFDGIPFMVVGRRVYSCHQGLDKHKHDKQTRQLQLLDDHSDHCYKKRRSILKDSKKLDCPARIYVVHLIRFPDYKIPDDIHKQRKECAGRLRRALATNPSEVKFEEQYVACFPGIEEHKNHPVVREGPVDRSSTSPKDGSKTKKRQKCGSLLRQISALTPHLQEEPFLDSLIVRLNDLLEDVRRHSPKDDPLPLSDTPPSKKVRYLKSLSMIPQKRKNSGRFGRPAKATKSQLQALNADVM
ncbi:uncharacterized protein si:dkey-31c13.1 isoform X1 [Perca fluviatilis]|uniref:uncharacterized protein si:dkey-31c13.1 isoform X1 n=1 Tax=Perca fluviatilis TaxID=8168 RepID=UPI001966AF94|nr:uncharacterized protein si:dkey-31c13.1 isoform X1 [Perca fluviatilis]